MRINIRTCITYKIIISLRRALTETCVEQKEKKKKKEVEVEVVGDGRRRLCPGGRSSGSEGRFRGEADG